MKRKIFLVLFIISFLFASPIYSQNPSDIAGHWAEKDIKWAIEKGIISGYPDGTFKPNAPITKAEYYRITNQSEPLDARENNENLSAEEVFSDIKKDDWFYNEVQLGLESGYIDSKDQLNPNENIERQDAIRIISHTQKWDDNLNGVYRFKDYGQILEKYRGSVGAATVHNLVKGYPDGNLKPKSTLTRAEVVTLIKNLKSDAKPVSKANWRWSFKNNGKNFNKGYSINERDFKDASKWFKPTDLAVIRNSTSKKWGGSCFGFAYTSALYAYSQFDVTKLNEPPVNNIADVKPQQNYNAQSVINLFQNMQGTTVYQDFLISFAKVWDKDKDLEEYIGFLKGYLDSAKNGGSFVQLAAYWFENNRICGHALVAYDYEDDGNNFTVKVYDCNGLCDKVIFNRNAKTITGVNLSPVAGSGKDKNLVRSYAYPTKDFAKFVKERSGSDLVYISLDKNSNINIKSDGKDYKLNDGFKDNFYYHVDSDKVTYQIKKGKSYEVTGDGNIDIFLVDRENSSYVNTDGFKKLTITDTNLNIEGQKGNYKVCKTTNSKIKDFKWDSLEVKGQNAKNLSLKRDAKGYQLQGDNLKNAKVEVFENSIKHKKQININKNNVYITEKNNEIVIKDKDNKDKKDQNKDKKIQKNENKKENKKNNKKKHNNKNKDYLVGKWAGKSSDPNASENEKETYFARITKNSSGNYDLYIKIEGPYPHGVWEYKNIPYSYEPDEFNYREITGFNIDKYKPSYASNPEIDNGLSYIYLYYKDEKHLKGKLIFDFGEGCEYLNKIK